MEPPPPPINEAFPTAHQVAMAWDALHDGRKPEKLVGMTKVLEVTRHLTFNTHILKKMSCQQNQRIFGAQMKRCDEEVEEDKGTSIIFVKEDLAAERKPS